jgi:hypothetical protein
MKIQPLFILDFNHSGSIISINQNNDIDETERKKLRKQCWKEFCKYRENSFKYAYVVDMFFKYMFAASLFEINTTLDEMYGKGHVTFHRVISNNDLPAHQMYACYGGDINQFKAINKIHDYTFANYMINDIIEQLLGKGTFSNNPNNTYTVQLEKL